MLVSLLASIGPPKKNTNAVSASVPKLTGVDVEQAATEGDSFVLTFHGTTILLAPLLDVCPQ